MRKEGDGLWRVTVDFGPKENGFTIHCGRQWMADLSRPIMMLMARRPAFVLFGVREIGGASEVPKGRVETLMLESKAWGKSLKLKCLPTTRLCDRQAREAAASAGAAARITHSGLAS